MRKIVNIKNYSMFKRAMIHALDTSTYLYLYKREVDCHQDEEIQFDSFQEVYEYTKKNFDIAFSDWKEINDTVRGCYSDFIHAVYEDSDHNKLALGQAADGNIDWCKALLEAGADPDGLPLILAIQCDEPEIVKLFIEAGAKVNTTFHGITPLIHSFSFRSNKITQILIDAGADVNMHNGSGESPLEAARKLEEKYNWD